MLQPQVQRATLTGREHDRTIPVADLGRTKGLIAAVVQARNFHRATRNSPIAGRLEKRRSEGSLKLCLCNAVLHVGDELCQVDRAIIVVITVAHGIEESPRKDPAPVPVSAITPSHASWPSAAAVSTGLPVASCSRPIAASDAGASARERRWPATSAPLSHVSNRITALFAFMRFANQSCRRS